jgi:endonuclease YncB( thermonuclease family)
MPYPHSDECINPALESMSWRSVEGRVTDVMSVRTFRMRTDKGEIVEVSLANVGEPFDAGAEDLLRKRILGARVSVFSSSSRDLKSDVIAEVHDRRHRDLSNDLLRKGAAAFTMEPAYTLSGYSECLNRIAEREAKAEGLGIWHH